MTCAVKARSDLSLVSSRHASSVFGVRCCLFLDGASSTLNQSPIKNQTKFEYYQVSSALSMSLGSTCLRWRPRPPIFIEAFKDLYRFDIPEYPDR